VAMSIMTSRVHVAWSCHTRRHSAAYEATSRLTVPPTGAPDVTAYEVPSCALSERAGVAPREQPAMASVSSTRAPAADSSPNSLTRLDIDVTPRIEVERNAITRSC
jgi:hypothetical protein